MYYHFAILLLFRPLIKLRIIASSISPRDVCSQAADAISGLLRSYAQLYTLRRTPSFVPYFVLTSSIVHLAIAATYTEPSSDLSESVRKQPKLPPHVTEALRRGISDLTEMTPCHHFAQQALNILRYLAKKWSIHVEIKTPVGEVLPPQGEVTLPGQNVQPATSSLNFFAPNLLESDFNCAWGDDTAAGADGDVTTGTRLPDPMQASDAMESPMFWPFTMQARATLPTALELEKAGFELI